MKKLLKSEVCESHEQCTGPTGVHNADMGSAKRASQTHSVSHSKLNKES